MPPTKEQLAELAEAAAWHSGIDAYCASCMEAAKKAWDYCMEEAAKACEAKAACWHPDDMGSHTVADVVRMLRAMKTAP
jgi:hypothetical protein